MNDVRCTERKHVIENGKQFCDCGKVMIGSTVAANAKVVTLLNTRRLSEINQA